MIQKLARELGIDINTRNLHADYMDKDGNFYNKSLQTASPRRLTKEFIVSHVRQCLIRDGYILCGLVEIYGDYEMSELEEIARAKYFKGKEFSILYFDREKMLQ